MKKISLEEQRKIREKAKNKLLELEKTFQDETIVKIVDAFKNKFNICETVYKEILSRYLTIKDEKCPNAKALKLQMSQICAALKFAGYNISSELLNNIFGGKSKVPGIKTLKGLRDSVTHGYNENSVKEIVERKIEIFDIMEQFLTIIKNFDFGCKYE